MPEELSRNQSILRFDVILQHDWPIEQCLLYIRENEESTCWSFHPLAEKTNKEHLPKTFFKVIQKSLYMLFKETCMNLEKPLIAYVNLLSCFLEWFYLTR